MIINVQEYSWTISIDPYEGEPLSKPVELKARVSEDGLVIQGYVDGCEIGQFVLEVTKGGYDGPAQEDPVFLTAHVWPSYRVGNDPVSTELFDITQKLPCDEEEA